MKTSTIQAKTAADDPLAALLARREQIAAEINRLSVPGNQVAAAESRLAEVQASLNVINEAEASEWTAWAESGDGPAPVPMLMERAQLASRQLEAQTALDAARAARAGVEPKLQRLQTEMEQIRYAILDSKIAGVVQRAKAAHAEALDAAARVAEPMTSIVGLRDVLRAEIGAANSAGDTRRASALTAAIGTLDALQPPLVTTDNQILAREATRWRSALL